MKTVRIFLVIVMVASGSFMVQGCRWLQPPAPPGLPAPPPLPIPG